jgi:hypothetical protein
MCMVDFATNINVSKNPNMLTTHMPKVASSLDHSFPPP